jgi:tetraacyldisaccharide 4'-kinase
VVSGRERGPLTLLLRGVLAVLSVLYGGVVRVRNFLYDRRWWLFRPGRLPAAVVSVGNIAVGGTGKTPFVEVLSRRLLALGRRPCILSRGYGSRTPAEANDEFRMLRERIPSVPHIVGEDRVVHGIEAVLRFLPDVLLLDDGFQHRRLARDLDIVLVDALQPLGFGNLLPLGRLREPARGLRRASLVCLTHTDLVTPEALDEVRQRVARLAPGVPVLETKHQPQALRAVAPAGDERAPESLADKPVWAFCALGSPASFLADLEKLGADVVGESLFPDHHQFRDVELDEIDGSASRAEAEWLVCTHKDAVKLPDGWQPALPVFILMMELVILSGQEALEAALAGLPRLSPEEALHPERSLGGR